ncbi:structural cement protein Gp24 [Bartonella sp. LJL80]
MFQNQVEKNLAFGLVGELAFDGPTVAQSAILKSANAANNIVGRAFSVLSGAAATEGGGLNVQAGGNGVFAGILSMPKSYAGADLTPTLTLDNGQAVELVLSGEVIVATDAATKVGDIAFYDIASGALSFASPGTKTPEGKLPVPNAAIHFYTTDGASVAVLKLNN